MSEYADSHSKASRKERVDRMLGVDPKGKIDASGYTPPGPLDAEKKIIPCPTKRTCYAKGGKVEGKAAHHHAGRKSRDAGGPTAIQQLRPQVPTSGLYGSGFAPTHSGMLAQGAGLKKGGDVKNRACGGKAGERRLEMAKEARKSRAEGGKTKEDYLRTDKAQSPANPSTSEANYNRAIQGLRAIPVIKNIRNPGYDDGEAYKNGGRTKRAEGGRTKGKGKTNINIIIGSPKDQQPMVPPPPSAMPPAPPPPRPGLPPAAMGAMSGPGGGMGAPGGAPPGMPPQMPPGMGRG